jgi:cell division protein FtsX
MLSFLKHISVRIWLTVLIGGVVCLWVLPSFQAQIGLQWVLLPVVLILVTAFLLIGWVAGCAHPCDRISADRLGFEPMGARLRRTAHP